MAVDFPKHCDGCPHYSNKWGGMCMALQNKPSKVVEACKILKRKPA